MPLAGIISAFGAFLIRRRQRLAGLTAAMVQDDGGNTLSPLEAAILDEPRNESLVPTMSKK
jgi:hypothetical protein